MDKKIGKLDQHLTDSLNLQPGRYSAAPVTLRLFKNPPKHRSPAPSRPISHLRKHWFLYLLAIALAAGFFGPQYVNAVAQLPGFRSGLVACVLFLMGLTLQPDAIFRSMRYPKASLLALSLNIFALPLLAALFATMLPPDLGAGLIVVAAVPCTLASASIWTRKAGGNDAVSMLVTLVTNLLCFLIAPLTLQLLVGRTIEIDFAAQATTLALIVVLPLTLAQLIRLNAKVANWSSRHRLGISTTAQVGILIMVANGPAAAVQRMQSTPGIDLQPDFKWLLSMATLTILLHIVMLLGGWRLANAAKLSREDSVAVAISGSQKTLMVGLQIAIDCGVSILPMVIYHVGQLVIDTFWAEKVARPIQLANRPPFPHSFESSPAIQETDSKPDHRLHPPRIEKPR